MPRLSASLLATVIVFMPLSPLRAQDDPAVGNPAVGKPAVGKPAVAAPATAPDALEETLGSWRRIGLKTEFTLWAVTCIDSLRCHAVGDYGVIISTTDGGEQWTQRLSPNQFALRGVHFFDDSTGIIAGFRGSCFRTTDGGGSWTAAGIPTDATLPGMCAVGNTVWLSGAGGTILKSTDRGARWTVLESGTDAMLDAISFADEQHGWATSVQRAVLRSTDGGRTWQDQTVEAFSPITTVYARSSDECWIAGYHGLLMRTLDGGLTWQRIEAYNTDYAAIAFDAQGNGWAVGTRGAVVRAEGNNLRWRLHDLTGAKRLSGIAFLPNNTAIVVGDDGAVFKHDAPHPHPATPARSE